MDKETKKFHFILAKHYGASARKRNAMTLSKNGILSSKC